MFRIYAEKTKRVKRAIFNSPLVQTGCTITNGIGFWNGKKEKSFIVEVTDEQEAGARALSQQIVLNCGQEAVLLVHLANTSEFIT